MRLSPDGAEVAMPAYVRFIFDGIPIHGSVPSGLHLGWTELAGLELAPEAGETPRRMWLLTRRARASPPLRLRPHSTGANFLLGDGSVRLGDGSVRTLSSSIAGAAPSGPRSSRSSQLFRFQLDMHTDPRRSGHPGAMNAATEGGLVRLSDGSIRSGDGSVRVAPDVADESLPAAEIDLTERNDSGELTVLQVFVHGVRVLACEPVAHAGAGGNDVAMEKIVIVHERITPARASRSAPDISQQLRERLGVYGWAYLARRPGLFDIYDYPGDYAQRFDGTDK